MFHHINLVQKETVDDGVTCHICGRWIKHRRNYESHCASKVHKRALEGNQVEITIYNGESFRSTSINDRAASSFANSSNKQIQQRQEAEQRLMNG